jgi:hypothetical protein
MTHVLRILIEAGGTYTNNYALRDQNLLLRFARKK